MTTRRWSARNPEMGITPSEAQARLKAVVGRLDSPWKTWGRADDAGCVRGDAKIKLVYAEESLGRKVVALPATLEDEDNIDPVNKFAGLIHSALA